MFRSDAGRRVRRRSLGRKEVEVERVVVDVVADVHKLLSFFAVSVGSTSKAASRLLWRRSGGDGADSQMRALLLAYPQLCDLRRTSRSREAPVSGGTVLNVPLVVEEDDDLAVASSRVMGR